MGRRKRQDRRSTTDDPETDCDDDDRNCQTLERTTKDPDHSEKTTRPGRNESSMTRTTPNSPIADGSSTTVVRTPIVPVTHPATDVLQSTRGSGTTTKSQNEIAALVVTVPSLTLTLVLLVVCFVLLWKKTCKSKRSKRDSLKSQTNDTKQELGEVKGKTVKDPYPIEQHSLNHYAEPNGKGKGKEDAFSPSFGEHKGKLKDPYPIEPFVTPLNNYTDTDNSKMKEGALSKKNDAVSEAQYAEVDENTQPTIPNNGIPQNESPAFHLKVDAQGNDGYEEAFVRDTPSNDGYEEAIKVKGTQNEEGCEKAKDRGTQDDDQGYETAKVTGPFYHTLDPDAPSDSSYMSVSDRKQDGGYDTLDRLKKPSQTKSKTDSGYDLTERIGKGDATVEPTNQVGHDYSAISRSSANTADYDKLDQTRRGYGTENISPNPYNVLQPRGND